MLLTNKKLREIQDAMDNKAIDISADGMLYERVNYTDDDGYDGVRFRDLIHLEALLEAIEGTQQRVA